MTLGKKELRRMEMLRTAQFKRLGRSMDQAALESPPAAPSASFREASAVSRFR
jgi:hypothetical protein